MVLRCKDQTGSLRPARSAQGCRHPSARSSSGEALLVRRAQAGLENVKPDRTPVPFTSPEPRTENCFCDQAMRVLGPTTFNAVVQPGCSTAGPGGAGVDVIMPSRSPDTLGPMPTLLNNMRCLRIARAPSIGHLPASMMECSHIRTSRVAQRSDSSCNCSASLLSGCRSNPLLTAKLVDLTLHRAKAASQGKRAAHQQQRASDAERPVRSSLSGCSLANADS